MLCFAYCCNHRSFKNSCSFYRFPKNRELRTLWASLCRRADREPTYGSRLCSCHFKDGLKRNKPTIFNFSEEKKLDSPEESSEESPEEKDSKDTFFEMIICCVPLCNSHGGQISEEDGKLISFHELPTDPKRREVWLNAIKNKEDIPIKFWDPIKKGNNSVICNLHFQPKDFVSGVKFRCLLPQAIPSIFPNYKSLGKKIKKRKKTETEKKDVPVSKMPCEEPIATENSSSNHAQNLEQDLSDVDPENTSSPKKKAVPPKKKGFGFNKLHKSLSSIQKPSQYWGVTPTDKFIIFSRWNDNYIPEKRVVIEHNFNVKVFLGELEINTMNLMEFSCPDDVSDLLDKVDSINYSGKSLAMNDIN